MNDLQPYFHFDGTCEQALGFYQACFGGTFEIMFRQEGGQRVLHSEFRGPSFRFMAADAMPSQGAPAPGSALSLALNCSRDDQDRWLAALSQGGEVAFPLHDTFYGGRLAMVIDRYGFRWLLNLAPAAVEVAS